jgi:rhodanese-related sulfurtransferase
MTSSSGGDQPGAEVSERWAAWRREVDLEEYEARWARMAAGGQGVHGEADLIASLGPGPVLDAGCGTGRVAIELARRRIDVVGVDLDPEMVAVARAKAPELTWLVADLATMQLDRRFPIVAMAGNVLLFARPADHRLIIHTLASHLEPGGRMVAGFTLEPGGLGLAGYDELCRSCGLELEERWSTWDREPFTAGDGYHVSVHRRTERVTVHDLLHAARQEAPRLTPEALREELAADPEMVVLDTRTPTDRERFGVIPGSIHAPRTVLEWAADPASGYSDPAVRGFDQRLVVVCHEGYSSSLAAQSLRRLGFHRATDLVGGVAGWRAAGLPLVAPDHERFSSGRSPRSAPPPTLGDLRARREATVREHMAAENRRDVDATIATFAHPRYELVGTGHVFDGEAEVREYFRRSRTPFPDQRNELVALHHGDDAIVVELDLLGTHLGPLGDHAPTGRTFRARMAAVFAFAPAEDRISCERVYFDPDTILRQLGLG